MSPILEVTSLGVRFGGVQAVDDVTFQLGEGEILGVIGPNGAGKTTMFDAISGFVSSTGRVVLQGNDISGRTPEGRARARLGRSFQDARLFPSLTVSETMAVAFERHIRVQDPVSSALSLPWVRSAERAVRTKVEELIELMGLGAFRDKFISELSTGSRRIVDLAVIMAHDPLVLLLDEPSSGIAQRETEALGPLLTRIRQETGASLIVIEHDMPLITSISDRLLALETGRVLTEGLPADVLDDPRLVAAYLGTDRSVVDRSGAVAVAPANGATSRAPSNNGSARRRARTQSSGADGAPVEAVGRRSPTNGAAKKVAGSTKGAGTAAGKKAPAKKAAAKKAAAKKTSGSKTAAAAKPAAKKPQAKKASAKKAGPAKKASAKKAGPAKKIPARAKAGKGPRPRRGPVR